MTVAVSSDQFDQIGPTSSDRVILDLLTYSLTVRAMQYYLILYAEPFTTA